MKKLLILLVCLVGLGTADAARVSFSFTNSVGQPDTNWFTVTRIDDYVATDGSFITRGLPLRLTPASDGKITNSFSVGNYVVTNRYTSTGFLIRVPQDATDTVYDATSSTDNGGLALSGYNRFVNSTLIISTGLTQTAIQQLTVSGSTNAQNAANATNLYPSGQLSVNFNGGTLTSGNAQMSPGGFTVANGGSLTPSGFTGSGAGLTNVTADTITNSTAQIRARSLDLTNGGWMVRFATNVVNNTSNFIISVWPTGAEIPGSGFGIRVGATEGDNNLYELLVNPRHGSAAGEAGSVDANEVQITSAGHFAKAPGYQSGRIRHDQIGIGLENRRSGGQSFNQWAYRQACAPTNGEPGYSYADTWRTRLPNQNYYPGIIGRAYTNNILGFGGFYDMALMRNLNVAVGSKWDDWDITNVVDGASIYYFTNDAMRGFRHWGAFVQTTKSTTVSGAAIPLDFGNSTHQRLNISQASISLYTTNVYALSTNYQRVVFHFPGSGLNVTNITYPSWLVATNVTAPAGIPQGYFMRLEVESFGIGDTNKVLVAAGVGPDSTFSFDADAQAFFARASGLPDAIRSNAVNNLVLNLKATNLWTKLDAFYPFAGTDATDNAQNLKSSSFTGSFTGTPAQSDGFVADGSDDFMATGFIPSSAGGNYTLNSAHIAVYLESATVDDLDRPIAVYDSSGGVKLTQLRRNGTTIQMGGPNGTAYVAGAAFGGNYTGFWATSRTNSTHATIQLRTSQATGSQASSALPTKQFYIGANNNDGTAASFTAAAFRCASIGGGLTEAELNALKWCIEQYIAQMP